MAKKKYKSKDEDADDSHHEANAAHDGDAGFTHQGDEECDGEYECGGEGMEGNCEYS